MSTPSRPTIKLEQLTFADGTSLTLGGDDLVVIAGPNNSGKSLFLRELKGCLQEGEVRANKIVVDATYSARFTSEQLVNYCLSTFKNKHQQPNHIPIMSHQFHESVFDNITKGKRKLHHFADFFVDFVETVGRIEGSNPAPGFDRTRENPLTAIQHMFYDEGIENKVSHEFFTAFGQELIVHRQPFNSIPLYVGARPVLKEGENLASTSYLSRLEALSKLEEQGDGMRSFVTIVSRLAALERPVLLIDEPEAFLHPPQARLLGRIVGDRRAKGVQIFVATHSADFIKGVMEGRPENLHFGRISRGGPKQIFWVNPAHTQEFLNDPLLRTTNALDGMLHDTVVLTEADRDSVFYQVILDAVAVGRPPQDRLFLHTGGKHRLPHMTLALSRIGVLPKIIVDIDILRTDDVLEQMIKAKGADPTPIMKLVSRVKADVEQSSPPVSGQAFKTLIAAALAKITREGAAVPKDVVKDIEAAIKHISPWSTVKAVGKVAFKGDSAKNFQQISGQLEALDIWIVPVGELEGFLRTGASKGQKWLEEALSRPILTDPDLADAREFVGRVFS